ncbi:MAG: hypothetical protein ACFFDM_08325 [Candidatus Thorarchaeota archaeon]
MIDGLGSLLGLVGNQSEIRVVKMRGANHSIRPVMIKIGTDGITAFPDARLPE